MKQEIVKLIEQALATQKKDVDNSFPSIFSRDDVKLQLENFGYELITIVMEMKEEKSSGLELTFEQRQDLEGNLREAIERKLDRMDDEDVVDFDSAEFNIEYNNTIVLDSININSSSIAEELDYVISDVISDFFSPVEVEEEQVKEETPSI